MSTNDTSTTPPTSPSGSATGKTAFDNEAMVNGQAEKEKVFASTGVIWSVVLGFIVALAVVIFIAQNTAKVQVNFLWLHGHVPLAVLLLVVVFAAVVVDELAGVVIRFQRRRQRNRVEKLKRQANS